MKSYAGIMDMKFNSRNNAFVELKNVEDGSHSTTQQKPLSLPFHLLVSTRLHFAVHRRSMNNSSTYCYIHFTVPEGMVQEATPVSGWFPWYFQVLGGVNFEVFSGKIVQSILIICLHGFGTFGV